MSTYLTHLLPDLTIQPLMQTSYLPFSVLETPSLLISFHVEESRRKLNMSFVCLSVCSPSFLLVIIFCVFSLYTTLYPCFVYACVFFYQSADNLTAGQLRRQQQ